MPEIVHDWPVIRALTPQDAPELAEMNADPAVMQFIGRPLSRAESDAQLGRFLGLQRAGEYAPRALELEGMLVGWVGLLPPSIFPAPEIAWRLRPEFWGRGYASWGARQTLREAADSGAVQEIVAFTAATNTRSRSVMERADMAYAVGEDFDHPSLPGGDPLRRHVLYRYRIVDSKSSAVITR